MLGDPDKLKKFKDKALAIKTRKNKIERLINKKQQSNHLSKHF